jgi:hypothetical protein
MTRSAAAGADPIERYLDQLLVHLRGRAGDVRRILAETEDHLRDSVEAGLSEGLSEDEAQAQALARFGPARTVARRFGPAEHPLVPLDVLGHLAVAGAWLGGIGLAAVGVSGLVAGTMGSVWGASFVAGDRSGVTYTAARCADFFEYHAARTCAQAAASHHFDEVVRYRVAAGVLGVLVLLGVRLVRRRARGDRVGVLPDGFAVTIGTVVFGLAGAVLAVQGADQSAFGGHGAGQYLSAAIVCVVVASLFTRSLYRVLVHRSLLMSAPTATAT